MTRSKQQLVGHKRRRNAVLILDKGDQPYLPVVNRVRLQNQTEALLEEMRIKLLTTGEDLRPARGGRRTWRTRRTAPAGSERQWCFPFRRRRRYVDF
jgi:hypothetical protein